MKTTEASRELKYAAPLLERAAARKPGPAISAQRRHELAKRSLERL